MANRAKSPKPDLRATKRKRKAIPTTTESLLNLNVVNRDVGALRINANNARTHSRKQIEQIVASVRGFGFVNPILIDSDHQIIAGHGRLEAAKLLGLAHVPTIRLDHMTPAQKRAYAIVDNRLAELAGWDDQILAAELEILLEVDLEFEVEITGFEMPEIDRLIQGAANAAEPEDDLAEVDDGPLVTRLGDLWRLGRHRLFCGDVREAENLVQLLGAERAQMVITDPPYNVRIHGHVSGHGKVRHAEFAMAAGELSADEYIRFLNASLGQLAQFSGDGSIHFIFMDWRHLPELLAAGRVVYAEFKNLCVWNKANGGMGSLYRSKHELILVFKNGTAPHINNIELGRHGRNRTNVWDYPGGNTFREGRLEELTMHPTVKPVALIADAMLDCSHRGGIVLDGFGGSGTTIIAAERTGRQARVIELDPKYVDVAIRRWQRVAGEVAVLDATGESFDTVADMRGAGS